MIVTTISGGPGNQLFQYSIGQKLASERQCKLVIDIGWYSMPASRNVTIRDFVLADLLDLPSNCTVIGLTRGRILRHYLSAKNRVEMLAQVNKVPGYIKESESFKRRPFHTEGALNDLVLNGYWQTYSYTENVEIPISEKIFCRIYEQVDEELLKKILSVDSICVSVRKGVDYLGELDQCSAKYYNASVNEIARLLDKKISEIQVIVFSDNIEWCAENLALGIDNVTVVDFTTESIPKWQVDLLLGSMCKHHVISNSSFSWWVARLSEMRSTNCSYKIAPSRWWNGLPTKSTDICPSHWLIYNDEWGNSV